MGSISGEIKWNIKVEQFELDYSKLTAPKYSVFGEHIRHVAPTGLQCSMFCGGKSCKYDNPAKIKESEMAIYGLYSSWVTDDILATSRPSTEANKKHNVIEQFQDSGIKSIINLQHPGEHAGCGFGLQPGGFSYDPKDFMDNGIFFYNFGWNDYGVRSLISILDMVKVMDFAINNGKVAVHCHAGLGRTGVLIACYLIYSERCTAYKAIHKVRLSRPKAIQTRGQINCVKDFAMYLKPMWCVFAEGDKYFTLDLFMKRQRNLLHGEKSRALKYVPQIVFVVCKRLLELAGVEYDLEKCTKITHFGFMRNSILNTSAEQSVPSSISCENEEKQIPKVHSNEDLPSLSNQLQEQYQANSTPNVAFLFNDKKRTLKKGGITLEPLLSRSKRRNKKKISVEEDASSMSDSMDTSVDMSLDYATRPWLRADNISIASFSSNEGLTQQEIVLKHLALRFNDAQLPTKLERHKRNLNTDDNAWQVLSTEDNISALSCLLWSWLCHIDGPIVDTDTIEAICSEPNCPEDVFPLLSREVWKLCECFLTTLAKLNGQKNVIDRVLLRFAITLTQDDNIPRDSEVTHHLVGNIENESTGVIFLHFISLWLEMLKGGDM